jgi:hypothetical protein
VVLRERMKIGYHAVHLRCERRSDNGRYVSPRDVYACVRSMDRRQYHEATKSKREGWNVRARR